MQYTVWHSDQFLRFNEQRTDQLRVSKNGFHFEFICVQQGERRFHLRPRVFTFFSFFFFLYLFVFPFSWGFLYLNLIQQNFSFIFLKILSFSFSFTFMQTPISFRAARRKTKEYVILSFAKLSSVHQEHGNKCSHWG